MSNLAHVSPKVFHVIERQKAALDRIKAKTKEGVERATHSAVVGAVAYGCGYHWARNGQNGEVIGKASLSLVTALVGHTAAMVGPSAYAPYAAAAGDGGIASMAFLAGKEAGEKARANGKGPILKT